MAREKAKCPMWHRRFTRARNLLGEAVAEMEQAYFEDRHNETFRALHMNLHIMLNQVSDQLIRNYERGKKEGWLK